jgi:hypothetical protein
VLGSAIRAVRGPRKPGRIQGKYAPKDAMTPFERLFSLLGAASFQRLGITIEFLGRGFRLRCAQSDRPGVYEVDPDKPIGRSGPSFASSAPSPALQAIPELESRPYSQR